MIIDYQADLTSEQKAERQGFIDKFRSADCDDERLAYARKLAPMFKTRKEWKERHGRSYSFSLKHGVIANRQSRDITATLTEISKGRDDLHEYCQRRGAGMQLEFRIGEMYRARIALGETVDVALEACKLELRGSYGL